MRITTFELIKIVSNCLMNGNWCVKYDELFAGIYNQHIGWHKK